MTGELRFPAYDDLLHLTERGPELWSVAAPLERMRVPIGRRVVVVRDGGSGVVVLSPHPLPEDVVARIHGLGSVRALVVPTLFHDTRFDEAAEPFSEAPVFAPEGFKGQTGETAAPRPIESFDSARFGLRPFPIAGMPKVRETVFLHQSSRTLLVSDLVFHFPTMPGPWARTVTRMLGILGPPAVSRFFLGHVKDRPRFRESLRPLLDLDFEVALPSHGAPISTKTAFDKALERAVPRRPGRR